MDVVFIMSPCFEDWFSPEVSRQMAHGLMNSHCLQHVCRLGACISTLRGTGAVFPWNQFMIGENIGIHWFQIVPWTHYECEDKEFWIATIIPGNFFPWVCSLVKVFQKAISATLYEWGSRFVFIVLKTINSKTIWKSHDFVSSKYLIWQLWQQRFCLVIQASPRWLRTFYFSCVKKYILILQNYMKWYMKKFIVNFFIYLYWNFIAGHFDHAVIDQTGFRQGAILIDSFRSRVISYFTISRN